MSRAQLELQQSILGTSLVQPVSAGAKGGLVWVLSRQLAGQEKPWLRVIESLLELAERQNVDVHVCRRYLRKNGKMLFGWYVAVNSKGLRESLADINKIKRAFEEAMPNLEDASEPPTASIAPTSVRSPMASVTTTERPYAVPDDPVRSKTLPQGVMKITRLGRDENGDEMTVEEMALPHVTREMNVPKHQFGRGARSIKDEKGH